MTGSSRTRDLIGHALAAERCRLAETKTVMVEVRVDSENSGYEGFRALDGDPNSMWHTDFSFRQASHPHQITIDLGAAYELSGFAYLPRPGGGNGTIGRYECFVSDNRKEMGQPVAAGRFSEGAAENVISFPAKVKGRFFQLRALDEVAGQPWTSIAELRLLADGVTFRAKASGSFTLVREDGTPMSELEIQHAVLEYDLRNRGHFARIAAEASHPQSLILETDRDPLDIVLRRTAALLADVKSMPAAPNLADQERQLQELQAAASGVEVDQTEARYQLYEKVCRVRREIALSNPLLNFDELLFIKHRRSLYNHMCDQYYGMAAAAGGGLYVLANPFGRDGGTPQVRDVLADAVVANGRLKGEKLSGGPSDVLPTQSFDGGGNRHGQDTGGGTFLSPDLSYDGRSIVCSPTSKTAATRCIGIIPTRRRATGTKAAAFTSSG